MSGDSPPPPHHQMREEMSGFQALPMPEIGRLETLYCIHLPPFPYNQE